MEFVVFQLRSPLSSWGAPAVGEYRGSATHPSHSAIVGMLGAALGLQRADEAAHAALRDGYGLAVGLLRPGHLVRDYHTAQMPPRAALKGRPHATRRDELALPRPDLSTVLSTRDYRADAASLVGLAARGGAVPVPYEPGALAAALRTPRYPLYLGRKSCPPAAPLWPQVVHAPDALVAFRAYAEALLNAQQAAGVPAEPLPDLERIYVDDHVPAGAPIGLSVPRKDRLVRRQGWQFGDRAEHMAHLERQG